MTGVLSFELLIVACKFVTKSIYSENTETIFVTFCNKKTVFCIHVHESSVYFGCWDVFVSVAVVLPLWRGSHCREFKIRVDVWAIHTSQNTYALSVLSSSFDTPVALISTLACYFMGELYQQQAKFTPHIKVCSAVASITSYCLY